MAANVPNAEVLERLLIEIVGDDSGLRQVLDEAVAYARQAAQAMRDALAIDLSRLQREAEGVTQSFNTAGAGLGDLSRQFQQQLGEMQAAFDKVRDAGDKSVEEFEAYRRAALEALEALRPMATAAFGSAEAFEALVQHVRTAAYEQRRQREETEKSRQSEEELAETIKRLTNEVRSQRNLWAGRITSDEEFRESTTKTRAELLKLLDTVERGSDEYRKITQELAYAQRGLDSVNKVASRGGLAWTAQIALANQFGQQLRGLGPAGQVAAGGLGLLAQGLEGLKRPLTAADFGLKNILGTLARLPGIITLASGALAVGLAVGLTRLTSQAANAARELENATHRTGLTIEGLQELQHAARVTGVPLELLSTTMQRLQRRAADANAGNAGLAEAFRRLGVTLTDSEGKMRSTEDLLGQVADGLNRVENNADRVALAFKIFDTEGGRLLPLLAEGSDGINALREEARELGLVISGDTVLSLSQFHAEVETVTRQFEVLRIEATAGFLPVMRDAILPLVRDQLVPWLGNMATRLNEMADAFFDAGAEGDAFRAKLAAVGARIQAVGQFLLSLGQISVGLIQVVVSPFAALGVAIGNATVGIEALIDAYRRLFSGDFSVLAKSPMQVMREAGMGAASAIEAFAEQARLGLQNLDAGGELFIGAFDFAALEAQWLAGLEGAAQGAARGATPAARQAFSDLVENAVSGAVAAPPAGSIAEARAMVQAFTQAFENATTEEARRIADEQRQHWQGVLDAMMAPFQPVEATAAARLWTDRLSAELRAGIKKPIEVFNLVTQGIATAQERLEKARIEFGFDSQEYRDALAGLQFLESWLTNFQREWATEPITVTVTAEVAPVQGFLPDLTLPEQTKTAAQALVEYYSRLTRVADQQAKLTGTTEDTRAAWVETLEILESILPGLDEMSDDWLAVTTLILQARARIEELDEELGGVTVTAGGLVGALQRAAIAARDLWDSAQGSAFASELTGAVTAVTGFIGVTSGLRKGGLLAAFLGEDFDATATEISLLEAEIRGLVDRYDDLTFAERLRLTIASNRLSQLREQQRAEEEARAAVERFKGALEDWNAAVAAMGAEEDPLARRARELKEWFDAGLLSQEQFEEMQAALDAAQARLGQQSFEAWASGVASIGAALDPVQAKLEDLDALLAAGAITAEQHAAGLELVAAAQERLAAIEAAQEAERFAQAFEAWREQVQGIGRDTDPVAVALQQLNQWFDEGRVSAEEYAAALELVAAAQERLDLQQQAREAEKAAEAWKTARGQLDDLLGIGGSQWDELRKAAEAAFDAGIIGADELAKALKAIDILEVADGFRQVAAELSGAASIIPDFAADITKAFAQFTAGNTAGGIATAFQAATAAVRGLGAAFEDEARRGEAALDLIIGGAAALATALGGPAMGQAVAAVGEFVKSVLGDLSNGLAEIDKQVRETASRSQWLGEDLVRGIAEGATRQVSRGGLLGLLGFTKAELDEDAFRAGISIAEGLASGLVNTLRSGDFEEAWQSFIDDILVQGVIEAFMATAVVQEAIRQATELITAGQSAQAAATLDQLREQFRQVWETIQGITTSMPDPEDIERSVTFSLPDATVSVLAAPQWALELQTASERMSAAGESMLTAADLMVDAFTRPLQVEVPQARGVDAARSL